MTSASASTFVTGGAGLLGRDVVAELARRGAVVVAPTSAELDVTDGHAVEAAIAAARPHAVIHCAAMADVGACARDPDRARRVNVDAARNVAASCARHGVRMVAVSTDYVFPGDAGRPYAEDDVPAPINVYGETKLAGERAVARACEQHIVARVSWLFGYGRRTFVTWLAEEARVDGAPIPLFDQRGTPTSSSAAAAVLCDLAASEHTGIFHVSCAGDATRVELARAVLDHLRSTRDVTVVPADGSRPRDTRLAHPRLHDIGLRMPRWEPELAAFLDG